jgi:O-antigen ligase/tetratricopeptide (TPR) repeat protein
MGQSQSLSTRWDRAVAGVIATMLFTVPLLFWRGSIEPFESCKVALVQIAALAVLVLGGMLACVALPAGWKGRIGNLVGDPISLAMLLGGVSALVSTALSISPRTSLHGGIGSRMGLGTVLALLAIYFATKASCRTPTQARRLLLVVAVGLVPLTLYPLVQIAGLDPLAWEETSPFAGWTRPLGTLGHPNYLAGYVVMAVPLVICLAQHAVQQSRRALATGLGLLVLAAGVVVVASLSRAAWLAAGLIAAVLVGAHLWDSRKSPREATTTGPRWRAGLVVAVVLVFGGACAVASFGGPLKARVRNMTEMSSRLCLWTTAGRVFRTYPLTGCGLDTFDLESGRHCPAEYRQTEWGVVPTRAHNDFLHMLATQGALGGLAFLFLAAALVLGSWRALRDSEPQDRPLALALACAMLGWYVQNLFGFPVAATASLFAVVAGLLSRLGWPEAGGSLQMASGVASARRWVVPLATVVVLAGLAAAVVFVARPFLADCAAQQGDELLAISPEKALICHERAARLEPGRDLFHLKLAWSAFATARRCRDPHERRHLLERGRQAVEQACTLVPASGQNHANRGRLFEALARAGLVRPEEALAAFDAALERDPLNTAYLADAGRAAAALGARARALEYIHRGLRIDPRLGELHAGLAALALMENRCAEAEAHLARATGSAWHGDSEGWDRMRGLLCWTWLRTGRAASTVVMADNVLANHGDWLAIRWLRAQALEQLRHPHQASDEYQRILSLQPDHAAARAALARLQVRR